MLILWYRVKSRLAHFHPCLYPLVVNLRTYNHDMTMSVVGRLQEGSPRLKPVITTASDHTKAPHHFDNCHTQREMSLIVVYSTTVSDIPGRYRSPRRVR